MILSDTEYETRIKFYFVSEFTNCFELPFELRKPQKRKYKHMKDQVQNRDACRRWNPEPA